MNAPYQHERLISDINWAAYEVAILGIIDGNGGCDWDVADVDGMESLLSSLGCAVIGRLVQSEAGDVPLAAAGHERQKQRTNKQHERHRQQEERQERQPRQTPFDNQSSRPLLPCVAATPAEFWNEGVQEHRIQRFRAATDAGLKRSGMVKRRRFSALHESHK
ncbi:hypothetical protein SEUCBS139899_009128 [Sporothrix eucalyptigena]